MRLKRWQKRTLAIVMWIVLAVLISIPLNAILPNLWILAPILITVINLLSPRISDWILDKIFGKEEQPKPPFDVDKLGEIIVRGTSEEAKKEARRKELEGYLRKHYEDDLLPVMRGWFQTQSSTISIGDRPLQYSILSAIATYFPHEMTTITIPYYGEGERRIAIKKNVETEGLVISELSEPKHFPKDLVKEVVKHLSEGLTEDWSRWVNLKDNINSHLRSVVKTWGEIEKNVNNSAKDLGLVEWDGKEPRPTDYYWVNRLVEAVWIDPEYYQSQKKHIWDDYEIKPHSRGGWEFGGTWACSQNQQNLVKLKERLTEESNRISPIKKKFAENKSNLEHDGGAFESLLKSIENDYVRGHKDIPGSCPTCEEWLKELTPSGA